MRVITKRRINDFIAQYSDSESSLLKWYKIVTRTDFTSFSNLKQSFSSADLVDNLTVFNISGNKYRLIAAIHYNRGIIYLRCIMTHAEYDKGKWKKS